MKLYKIGMGGTDMFLKGVILEPYDEKMRLLSSDPKMKIIPIIAFDEKEEAIYEEDKAKFYVEELNKNDDDVYFYMKEVNYNEEKAI